MKSRIELGPVQLSLLLLLISRPGGSGSGSHTTPCGACNVPSGNCKSRTAAATTRARKVEGNTHMPQLKWKSSIDPLRTYECPACLPTLPCVPEIPHEIEPHSALSPSLSVSYGNFYDYYYWVREKLHLSIVRRVALLVQRDVQS